MLTKEQADEIKKQLLSQVKNLPQENKEQIKQQISNFNEEQLEAFAEKCEMNGFISLDYSEKNIKVEEGG